MKNDPIIRLEDAHRSYYLANGDEIPVLRGIYLSIAKGEFVAIMGESGGGKTTLLNIIGCLHPLTSGKYYLFGEDIAQVKDDFTLAFIRNKKIGFVFQQFNLLSRMTALQNVCMPAIYAGMAKDKREARARKMLENIGLGERIRHKPTELSGGQQQRVAIARALINEPDILLADEPTGALDSAAGAEIMGIFMQLKSEGRTIVMVTHTHEVAKYADRIIYMRDGQIVDDDYKLSQSNDCGDNKDGALGARFE
jgi:putative ABC transport system ATP-binding protein